MNMIDEGRITFGEAIVQNFVSLKFDLDPFLLVASAVIVNDCKMLLGGGL